MTFVMNVFESDQVKIMMVLLTMAKLADQTALIRLTSDDVMRPTACRSGRCAASRVYGDSPCDQMIKQIVLRKGVLGGLPEIYAQLLRCKNAAQQLSTMPSSEAYAKGQVKSCIWFLPLMRQSGDRY